MGESLAAGKAKRPSELGELGISVGVFVAFTEDEAERAAFLDVLRPQLALYIGGMGAKGKNFYNDLACRYGFEDAARTIQDLYLAGKKAEAAAAVPDELLAAISLVGPGSFIKDRLAALDAAGVTTIKAHLLDPDRVAQLTAVESLVALAP